MKWRDLIRVLPVLMALLWACTDNPSGDLAGTSSGVDNPKIIVSFRDSVGKPMRVTGTLSLFVADQNPAVDAVPIIALNVNNSSYQMFSGSKRRSRKH